MTDREKAIKGLECAIGIRGIKNCDDCPYDSDFNCIGCDIVMRDALELLKHDEQTIESLERTIDKLTKALAEKPDVVRCKDCKHYKTHNCPCESSGDPFIDWTPDENWFCADGEVNPDADD